MINVNDASLSTFSRGAGQGTSGTSGSSGSKVVMTGQINEVSAVITIVVNNTEALNELNTSGQFSITIESEV